MEFEDRPKVTSLSESDFNEHPVNDFLDGTNIKLDWAMV